MADREDRTEPDTEQESGRTRGRRRGGSPSAIAAALTKDPQPGPQHWGGPRPRRPEPDVFFPRFHRFAPEDP
ncbi:hypothetical protein [Nocardiopsis alkaliphila]|uniref:hypothetical protein n=1 Tax=Nocardiopsis alkaliphila TaxID=225762 RepID=UPI00034877FE|nr:hypothetical protein [Nocardiopsis alkaliphila]